ncbi:MAG: hypothetical protein ABFD02_02715 [Bacteroidales bacterium]
MKERAAMISENAHQDKFKLQKEAFFLIKWLNRAANLIIIFYIILYLQQIPFWHEIILRDLDEYSIWPPVIWIMACAVCLAEAGINSILYYLPLQTMKVILKILINMEYTSHYGEHALLLDGTLGARSIKK